MNDKEQWRWLPARFVVVTVVLLLACLVVGCVLSWAQYFGAKLGPVQIIVLAVQTIVLAFTLRFVERYTKAAGRQADIMKDQFDVAYTPHLRPYVARVYSDGKSVLIALKNLVGIAAIHPGVYPEWSQPTESAHYGVLSEDMGSDLPIVRCATGQLIEVGETWYCRVALPREDSGTLEVRYEERPRKTDVWTLGSLPDMQGAWHFVAEPEEPT